MIIIIPYSIQCIVDLIPFYTWKNKQFFFFFEYAFSFQYKIVNKTWSRAAIIATIFFYLRWFNCTAVFSEKYSNID